MRVHHLNCISTCPLGGKLMDGRTDSFVRRGELACHCLLVETADSLVLIDTGLGLRDVAQPRERLSAFFLGLLSPAFREEDDRRAPGAAPGLRSARRAPHRAHAPRLRPTPAGWTTFRTPRCI
jgi:hypothetical protein